MIPYLECARMDKEYSDPAPFLVQLEMSSFDAFPSASRERALKGLTLAVAGSLLLHVLAAGAILLSPLMRCPQNAGRPCLTASLVDCAEIAGGPGKIGTADGAGADPALTGSPAAAQKAQDTEATDVPEMTREVDLPDWPETKPAEPRRPIARPAAAKILSTSGSNHKRKTDPSHERPAAELYKDPPPSVHPGSDVAANDLGERKGQKLDKLTVTGEGAGEGTGKGIGEDGGQASQRAEHHASAVDKVPEPLRKYEPVYPDKARELGISGKVVVKFVVESDGRVSRPSILEAHPQGVFEQNALDAILRWRFKPGSVRGIPVATSVILPFQFQLTR
jgi:TonB family protein